ncbi:hypothetical protein ACFLYR_08735 [Chloroflexota bacterium]
MALKAYLLIRINRECYQHSQLENMLGQLATIHGVVYAEQIDGPYDLLVQIEDPLKAVLIANKIMALTWIRDLHLRFHKVKPFNTNRHRNQDVLTVA